MARRVPLRMGPAAPPTEVPKPFTVLAKPRPVGGGLPSDLAGWFGAHEGVGRVGPVAHNIRLFKLAEVERVAAADVVGAAADEAWAGFAAVRVAVSLGGAHVAYVLAGQPYRFGTILAWRPDETALPPLVLAQNWTGWLARLDRDGWTEWALAPDRWAELARGKVEALRRHLTLLNPNHPWPAGPPRPPRGGTDGR